LRRIGRREQTDAVESALSATNLGDVATQVIGSLSRGYRQRVGLAQALLHDPPVLVLDEPTVGLDPRQVAETRSLLARLGKKRAVLLSSHLLSEVATLCRRVVIINHGRVVATRAVAELAAESHQQRVEVRVRGDNAATDAALRVVKTLAAVRTAALHGQTIVAHGTSADLAEQISTALTQAGHVITALTSSSESLEDAYLRLVRD
jgi:ABC-2 type transport system ATP-binding protein